MKYRKLGKTNLSISEIGMGCSGFWGDKHFSDAKATSLVREAFDQGINFFDTGSNYSNFNAEPRLGRAVKELLRSNPRESLILSTKAGSTSGYAPRVEDNDLSTSDFTPEAIRKSCLQSIDNLHCGHIDIFQLHGFQKEMLNPELFDCLLSMKAEGLIRHIGVNTHFRADMDEIAKHPEIFDMVLTDCNLLQLDRFEDIQKLAQAGIGVVVGTVLAQGHLLKRKIGSFWNGSFFWYLARTLIKPTTKDFARNSSRMRNVLRSIPEMSAAQAAFAYMLDNPNISGCLFGTTSSNNLAEVIGASGKQLTPESKQRIQEVFEGMRSLSR